MTTRETGDLTVRERQEVQRLLERISQLADFLKGNTLPADAGPQILYRYLAQMKAIQGNADNGVSLVACLMAKEYLSEHLEMAPFDVAEKAQGAAGLDIDEHTTSGERVIAEIKTTVPFRANDLGAAQRTAFEKDFAKLKEEDAAHKFFFVTEERTYDVMRARYAARLAGVNLVLLTSAQPAQLPRTP
jgi:hypothetical protein